MRRALKHRRKRLWMTEREILVQMHHLYYKIEVEAVLNFIRAYL